MNLVWYSIRRSFILSLEGKIVSVFRKLISRLSEQSKQENEYQNKTIDDLKKSNGELQDKLEREKEKTAKIIKEKVLAMLKEDRD